MRGQQKFRVLVVDDDRIVLTMYADYLSKAGFAVETAESAEDGLARVIAGGIDCVVTDIMMARMDGWQFLDYIRKDLGLNELQLPVIVMSAVASVDLDMEYMRHRANDWVTKPIQPLAKLAHKIMALLGVVAATGDPDDANFE